MPGVRYPIDHVAAYVHTVPTDDAHERLLPAVRAAGDDVLSIADGFSCHGQISQLGGRTALHLAEVLAGATPAAAGHDHGSNGA